MKPGEVVHYKGVDAIACSYEMVPEIDNLGPFKKTHSLPECERCAFVEYNTAGRVCEILKGNVQFNCLGGVYLPIKYEAAVKTEIVAAALKDAK